VSETFMDRAPEGSTVLRDDSHGTDAVLMISPQGENFPGAVGISMSEINGEGEREECFFPLTAGEVEPFVHAVLDAAAVHGDPPEVRSADEKVRDAIATLLFRDQIDDGIHSLRVEHDGDGWNEPFSARYWCDCHAEGENPTWTLDWMQSDPEQTGRPDPVEVLLAWNAHVDSAVEAAAAANYARMMSPRRLPEKDS
jgi:hypothetical protein